MNPSKYEILLKVAETESFTKTAEYFHYSQSSISQSVKTLEQEFGIILFHRVHQKVILSAEGQELLPIIRDICTSTKHLADKLSQIHQYNNGIVRIGAYASITCNWLPDIIKAFQQEYPNVKFDLYQEDDVHLLEQLESGIFDLAIISNPRKSTLNYQELYKDPFLAVLPPSHPLANKENLSIADLKDSEFITISRGFEKNIKDIFKQEGISPFIRCKLTDDPSVLAFIESEFAVTIMPELVTKKTSFNLVYKHTTPAYYRNIGLVTRKNDYFPWATKKFIHFLTEYASKQTN